MCLYKPFINLSPFFGNVFYVFARADIVMYQHKALFEELIHKTNLKQSKDYKDLIHIHLS